MKKLFSIFSLSVLLFSIFTPAFTYAFETENEAKQILTDILDETMSEFEDSHDVAVIEDVDDNISINNNTIRTLELGI